MAISLLLIFNVGFLAMPHQRIETNPEIMDGKPVIHGTRIPVELVLRKLGAGMTWKAILPIIRA
jgi:uncharacterized protein (DUF433 family)